MNNLAPMKNCPGVQGNQLDAGVYYVYAEMVSKL